MKEVAESFAQTGFGASFRSLAAVGGHPEGHRVNETISPPPAQPPNNTLSFWPRFRATFGPAVVGVVGGALTVGVASEELLAAWSSEQLLRGEPARYIFFLKLSIVFLMSSVVNDSASAESAKGAARRIISWRWRFSARLVSCTA